MGEQVYLNNKRLMVKSFTDYVKMYFKDDPTRDVVFEKVVDKTGKRRWEVAVTSKLKVEFTRTENGNKITRIRWSFFFFC